MAKEQTSPVEVDLDRTDRLPILDGTLFDHDVEDDAVPMDQTMVLSGPAPAAHAVPPADFGRASTVDLPSLAESVRSVEERISRQRAEYETLTRTYERSQQAEAVSNARASALAADLATARSSLESEQNRSRELDRALADRSAAVEVARARVEEALRETERHQGESRTLREALAARDASLAQVSRSLGERDAQLSALQREHAKIVPELEATSKSTSQLDIELQAARARVKTLTSELQTSRETAVALTGQLKRSESENKTAIFELGSAKTQASSYLDLLRTREWRRGFDQNLFRELDDQVGAAQAGQGAVKAERDRLQTQLSTLKAQLATQSTAIDSERARLTTELAARDRALAEIKERGSGEARKVSELTVEAERRQAEQATQIAQLRAEQATQLTQLRDEQAMQVSQLRNEQAAQVTQLQEEVQKHEQEKAVLIAHLQEARRPIQSIEGDVKRLTDELAAKSAAFAEFEEENRKLRASLERTRGALEEREFLIRRLERSESNNATVLGRIQTSIERLGAVVVPPAAPVAAEPTADWSAELMRIDAERPITHVLARRTRIGRATGCELHIDSGSVSRHHALVLVGPRETIIEDLNSTNGVFVNGRKISRQLLNDGDAVTIGDIQFRYFARPLHRASEPSPAQPTS